MIGKSLGAAWQSILLAALFCGLAFALTGGNALAVDWPHWRGPSRNGVTSEAGWLTTWPAAGLPRLWRANIGKSYASVSVQGTGERIYAHTREGLAFCLKTKDGSLLWQRHPARQTQGGLPPFGCASSPLVEGDLVIYNVGKHGIALNKQTGAVVWNSGPGVAGHASAVGYRIGGQRRVLLFTGSGLVGVELVTGRRLWSHPWTSPNHIDAVDPVVAGEKIFITGFGRAQQLRLAGETVAVVYETRGLRSSFGNPVLLDGHLYGSDRGALQCIEWATGAEKWRRPGGLLRSASPRSEGDPGEPPRPGASRPSLGEGALIAAGKHLIVLDEGGNLHLVAATPDAYRELAHARALEGPCWTLPVLANGLLYCRNNDGDLVCLDLRTAKPGKVDRSAGEQSARER